MAFVPNILIVDNEPRVCHSLKYLLTAQGYEANMAYTGSEGINRLSQKPYTIAIIDMVMPDISGPDLMEYINSYYPKTLVIAMTGYASTESAVDALRRGAYDYLIKPFEFETLQGIIQNALSTHHVKISYESSSKYRTLVEHCPDIIYTLDPDGKFNFINGTSETLLGLASNNFIGAHYTSVVYPEDINKAKWHLNERRTGERSTKGYELRLKTRKQGNVLNYITVELNAFGMYEDRNTSGQKKKFIGTCGIARDITQKQEAQDRAHTLEKMASIRTLAGGIAHDFNNALTVISGYTSILETNIPYDQQTQRGLQAIKNSVERMTNLTYNLLAYSEQVEHNKRPINLNDTIKKVIERMSSIIGPSIILETALSPKLALVEGDPFHIENAIMNVVMNAYEAIEDQGSVRILTKNVLVSSEFRAKHPELARDRYLLVQVKDTGVGMDEITLKRAFDPFFTTKFVGRGLGLSSALGIIKGHDGHIYLNSRQGEGTIASICLPLATRITNQ